MRTTFTETTASRTARALALPFARDNVLRSTALAFVVALAAALRFFNLSALGYANSYYAAAVESMLQSWHNFFFVAAEPGGSVSVDKPPVGFWLQAISAHFLGINSLGLLLPQIVAGLISVILVYHLVRRSFGTVAALLAALALAITPVVVATDRNNTIDSTLILTLLLAAWAFIKATEQGKLRYLLLGATLVGIGFNIKMLQAYLSLPAFFALYLLGSRERLWRKAANLTAASVLLVAISLSWAVAVDLTPADQRPYVGSSGDNSELSLAIGYNGVERLLGMGNRGSLLSGLLGGSQNGSSPSGPQSGSPAAPVGGAFPQPPAGADGRFPQTGTAPGGMAPRPGPGPGGPGGGGGMFNTGQAGPLRLFTGSLAKDIGWLLPFGLFSAVLLAFRARPRWPIDPKHQALVLWGGWLVTGAVFFSVAGFFHEYYLSMLGAPLAALVGIGAMELWGIRKRYRWIAVALLVAAAGATLALQVSIARAFVGSVWWLAPTVAVLAVGAVLLAAAAIRDWRRLAVAGFSCIVAAILIVPGIWSGLTSMDPSTSQNLPAAYSGEASRGFGGMPFGQADRGQSANQALLTYLESHTQGTKYLVAVASSQQGADLVLATGRPVLYIGGFGGQDKVVTRSDLTKMVADGELRYILWGGNGPGPSGGQSDISTWIAAHGTAVQGLDTQAQNAGGQFQGPGGMQGTLYQLTSSETL